MEASHSARSTQSKRPSTMRESMPVILTTKTYDAEDLSAELRAQIIEDCTDFQRDQAKDLALAYERYSHSSEWSHEGQAGHDFWLTRNRHGAGFWDRGLGDVGERLSKAARVYGSENWYVDRTGVADGEEAGVIRAW